MTSVMSWLFFLDTSRGTDFGLSLAVTCVAGGLTLYVAVAGGLGSAVAALALLTLGLGATTEYAWLLWRRERAEVGSGRGHAVKIRPPK